MDVEIIILSELSQRKMSIIWHCLYRESRKIIKMNLLIKQKDSQKEKTNTWLPKGKWGRDKLVVWDLHIYIAAAAKSLQSCPTLFDPIDGSPPGSTVPGILQARIVEWVAISFSNAGKWKVKVKSLSRVRLLATPWTAAYQAPPSMGFSRQEYWSGVPLPSLTYRHYYI